MKEAGKFICFEGGDGSGKTTQAQLLAEFLERNGYKVVLTHEPGGTEAGKNLRELILDPKININPRIALCLFLADRAIHIAQVIKPALKVGKIVICDRYEGSTFAYQCFAGGLKLDEVKTFNSFITDGLRPDVTLFIDVPVEVGNGRKKNQGIKLTHYDAQKLTFHQKLREGYLELSKILPDWELINGDNNVEEVHRKVLEALKNKTAI